RAAGQLSRDLALPSGSALPRSCPPAEEGDLQSREIWSRTQPALSREPRAPPPFPPLRQRPRSPRPPSPSRGGVALPLPLSLLSLFPRASREASGPRCRQRLARSRSHQRAGALSRDLAAAPLAFPLGAGGVALPSAVSAAPPPPVPPAALAGFAAALAGSRAAARAQCKMAAAAAAGRARAGL
ncbi:forkhead box protein D1-like, partial [Pyrgilauda ruficollis]|uniref:forkhead box protein D1-like n=1 Tax=Pyrgilauda ruficollis TaxID=221976 RepID=UPI001B881B30